MVHGPFLMITDGYSYLVSQVPMAARLDPEQAWQLLHMMTGHAADRYDVDLTHATALVITEHGIPDHLSILAGGLT